MEKLILLHQGALGDWVLVFPVMKQLRFRFDRIDAICSADHGELALKLNLIDATISQESPAVTTLFTGQPDTGLLQTIMAYDAILLFSTSADLKQSLVGSGHPQLLALAPKPPVGQRWHVTTYIFSALERAGWTAKGARKKAFLVHPDFRHPESREHRSDGPPLVLMHPGSGSPMKNCPFEKFLEIATMLTTCGYKVQFILGPVEIHGANWRDDLQSGNIPFHQSHDLPALVAHLKRADAYIGNDSGPTHLAAYLGLPTVALFGPSDVERWHPLGPSVHVVKPDPDCPPCFENDSRRCSAKTCFDHVRASAVADILERMLKP